MENDRRTIFLVDDDLTNLAIGNDTLEKFYNVFTFNSGSRLLKMLEKYTPDLILLDVNMPEMSGYEAAKIVKAREETKNIPVVFLTAQSDTENELEGLSLGAIDYIVKPFSPPLLLKRIEMHLLVESQKQELVHFNDNLQKMVEAETKTVVELKNAILSTMAELVEYRDDITGGHISRTQRYLNILLEALRVNTAYRKIIEAWNMELILQSAQLHDVGKIAIRDSILRNPGKLSDEEFAEIKTHVTIGESIIDRIKKNTRDQAFLDQAKVLVATHHEKWDGSGYPRQLKGDEIPLEGRLMAITDVYDALTSIRPYKKAFTHEEAVNIIRAGGGTQFDPGLVDVFLDVSGKFQEIALSGGGGLLRENQNEHSVD